MNTLESAFENFTTTAFRLETRDAYVVAEEAESLAAFKAGALLPQTSICAEWQILIKKSILQGKIMQRVHVIPPKLTEYLRYEIEWGYAFNQKAGEQINLLDESVYKQMPAHIYEDYWLFDNTHLFEIQYDENDQFISAKKIIDEKVIAERISLKDSVLKASTPLFTYFPALKDS